MRVYGGGIVQRGGVPWAQLCPSARRSPSILNPSPEGSGSGAGWRVLGSRRLGGLLATVVEVSLPSHAEQQTVPD